MSTRSEYIPKETASPRATYATSVLGEAPTTGQDRDVTPAASTPRDLNGFIEELQKWTDAAPKSAPVYQRGIETRNNIVNAARRAFIQIGYIDCSVEDILQEASISRGTFYSHFRSKKAVFAAVVEEHLSGRLNQTDVEDLKGLGYRERVRATVSRFLNNYSNTYDFSMVIEQAAHYDPAFRRIRLMIRDIFVRRIERGIVRQQSKGAVDASVDARTAATLILSMMTNTAQVEVGWRGRKPDDALIDTLVDFWCAGVGLTNTDGDQAV